MASQLLTFNPAFMRRRGGNEPTGAEPQDVYFFNRITVVEVAPDAQHVFFLNRIVVLEAS